MFSILTNVNDTAKTVSVSIRNLDANPHWTFDGESYTDGQTGVKGFRVVDTADTITEANVIAARVAADYEANGFTRKLVKED